MDANKARYARETAARTLGEIITGADIFLGLSAAGVLEPEMVKKMADRPLILALANPEPEIRPELAKEARPDAIIATADDAAVFGLNAVSDGYHVVLPVEAAALASTLLARGYQPVPVSLGELRKAGGGPKCCTLELRA